VKDKPFFAIKKAESKKITVEEIKKGGGQTMKPLPSNIS